MLSKSGISGRGRAELARVLAGGRRTVTPQDVASELEVDGVAAAKKLARWTSEGWLRRVRRGLYIPVPVDVDDPRGWSEDPLILGDAVWSPCFFTGWTAANHWGLTEQLFRTTVVKTTKRVRWSAQRLLDHEYLVTHIAEAHVAWGLAALWRGERRLQIADPARVVVDVLDDPRLSGGIRHAVEIVAAYLADRPAETLIEYGERLGNRTVFKRLGYLAERAQLGQDELVAACRERISGGIALLDPSGTSRGERATEWGLRANVLVEKDAPS